MILYKHVFFLLYYLSIIFYIYIIFSIHSNNMNYILYLISSIFIPTLLHIHSIEYPLYYISILLYILFITYPLYCISPLLHIPSIVYQLNSNINVTNVFNYFPKTRRNYIYSTYAHTQMHVDNLMKWEQEHVYMVRYALSESIQRMEGVRGKRSRNL